jgi:integrase
MSKRRGRGEGSIKELPSGKFRAIVVVRTVAGKKQRLTSTFSTKTEASDWLSARRTEKSTGRLSASKITLSDYLAEWLRRRIPTVEGKTRAFYSYHVDRLKGFAIAALPLRKLSRPLIESDMGTWGTSDQQRKALAALRMVLNTAEEDGLVPRNPAKRARRPKADAKRVSYWTADQARQVLTAATGAYLEGLFWLALDSGMRIGELLGLHWPEVDTVAGTVKVVQSLEDIAGVLRLKEPKTSKSRRTIRIGRGSCLALDRHRERMNRQNRDVTAGPVFVGERKGQLITHSTFYARYYRPIVKLAAVPQNRPYDMRHTCATLMLAEGVSIKVISERLGHEDITTTLKHYAHCLPDAQETAAKAADAIFLPKCVVPKEAEKPIAPRRPHGESEQLSM